MKKYQFVFLLTVLSLLPSGGIRAQDKKDELASVLSTYLSEDWLKCLREESLDYKYDDEGKQVVSLIKVEDCYSPGEESVSVFLLVNNKVIHFEEAEFPQNFVFLANIKTIKSHYLSFVHYSSIIGDIKYYFVDLADYSVFVTPWINQSYRFDYLSVDFSLKKIDYYFNNTEQVESLRLQEL